MEPQSTGQFFFGGWGEREANEERKELIDDRIVR